jgi:hypothetical protein
MKWLSMGQIVGGIEGVKFLEKGIQILRKQREDMKWAKVNTF